jgi:hypothetical protein
MAIYTLDVQDFLPLGQGDTHNPTAYDLNQWLSLSQEARTQIILENISHLFSPMQVVAFKQTIINLSVIDSFIMYQQGAKNAGTESIIDTFFMWQQARLVEYEQLLHSLLLTQAVVLTRAKAAVSTFVMTHAVSLTAVWNRTVTHSFAPVSKATGYTHNKYTSYVSLPTLTGPNVPEC